METMKDNLLYIVHSRIYFQQPLQDVQVDENYVPVTIETGTRLIYEMRLEDALKPSNLGLAEYWLEPVNREGVDLWS